MGRMVNMLFFDAANGKWGRSKPQPPPPLPNHSSITLVVAQFAALDISEDAAVVAAKQFADSIKSRCPTVVALNGVHEQILKALLSVDWIKQEYGVSEVHQPLGSVLLWHAGLPVQLAEGSEKPSYSAINMRRFFGCDCVVVAATFDQSATPETRTLEVHQVLQKASAGEGSTTLALFNPYQSPTYTGVIRDLLNKVRDKMGISEDLATPTEGPTVWLKGNNMMLSGVAPISVAHDAVASCIAATLLPTTQRSPLPEGNSPTPGSETPSNEAASPFPSTPPITSEAAAAAAAAASKKRMWSTKHSSAIRVRDGTDEVHYDLSVYFPKTEDGIKALCAGAFAWPVDYAILQGRLLAVHGQNADIPSFRQYMNNHPAPPKPNMTGVPGAVQPVVPRTEEKRRVKDPSNFSPYCLTTPTLSAGRRRTWSVYRVALLVQVTPREMRFDITEFVGVGPGTLQLAVARLNGQQTKPPQNNKQGGAGGNNNGGAGGNAGGGAGGDDGDNDPEDPLHNYRFDYALLYSSERHGYWLIAASDVPCDVISCRLAAKSLGASVASLLRAGAGN